MRQQKLNFLILIASLGAILSLVGLTNFARFSSFTEFGYGYFSTLQAHDGWRGLLGLLVAPGSGLIFFFPLVILVPLGAKYMYKENKSLFFFCIYVLVSTWLYTGTLSFGSEPTSWSGGIAWGPRYLVPIMPFLIIVLAYLFPRLRKSHFLKSMVIGLCLIGFYINLSGILVWVQYGLMYAWTMEGLAIYPNYMDFVTWSPSHSPIISHTKALMSNYVTKIFPQQYLNTAWSWTMYGNAPCEYDLYIYCKFGVVPFIVGSLGLATLSAIIIRKIRLFQFVRKEKALLLLASILPVRRLEKHR